MASKGDPCVRAADFDAALFDLDGVVTDTASVHAAAWKALFDGFFSSRPPGIDENLKPFSIKDDYPAHVDGKPRLDGIASFLAARGITIPYGSPDDPPDAHTVHGLGRRKNDLFLARLERDGADFFAPSVTFIRQVRRAGLATAIVTSSRNCAAILEAANITDLFDVAIDGIVAADLGLKGKPDPATYLEAARRLNTAPQRAIVLEDAVAGVQAGRNGRFGLVIGVDSTHHHKQLLKDNGADIVVDRLTEIAVDEVPTEDVPIDTLSSALDQVGEILNAADGKQIAFFLDYDGVLSPIVERPELAVLSPDMRETLERLADAFTVALVSGRDLDDLKGLVGIDRPFYAGSHGFSISGPGGFSQKVEQGTEFIPVLDQAEQSLRSATQKIEGVLIERKRLSLAVHYRLVNPAEVPNVEAIVKEALAAFPDLRVNSGKMVFDLQPDIDWNKGKAVLWLLDALGLHSSTILPIYIGDDLTDEDAFRALRGTGIGVVVKGAQRPTAAQYALDNTEQVGQFFRAVMTARSVGADDNWALTYDDFDAKDEGLREALCTLSNGYFATRGAAEESVADDIHYPGTYLAGGFNRADTQIGDRTITNEDLVNCPNWLPLTFRVGDDENWFDPSSVDAQDYQQSLDLKTATLSRVVSVVDSARRRFDLRYRRLVHISQPHLAAIRLDITPRDWTGPLTIRSGLDGSVTNWGVPRYRDLNGHHLEVIDTGRTDDGLVFVKVRTRQSRVEIAQCARTLVYRGDESVPAAAAPVDEDGFVASDLTFNVAAGETIRVEKVVAFFTSRDHAITESGTEARMAVARAPRFGDLEAEHRRIWAGTWRRVDIEMEPPGTQQMPLRVNLFHLFQTLSRNTIDLDAGAPARGLHGEAYRGHIFWDELFILPSLTGRRPNITRSLLLYRFRRLGTARRLAADAGFRGALYPWQSGSNGEEESQLVHLNPASGRWITDNSSLQRHVNLAIAYNVWRYFRVTHDHDFLRLYGIEMMVEIARLFDSLTTFNPATERFDINNVMGPDEYHDGYPDRDEPGLNNNAYTNIMAVWLFATLVQWFADAPAAVVDDLSARLDLRKDETDRWADMARRMTIPFHGDRIISQFEGYGDLQEFDWVGYREKYGDIHRLDRILEAEGDSANRYKLSKQADVCMIFYLLPPDQLADLLSGLGYDFDDDFVRRNVEYYLERTSHGSTLSSIVHAAVLAPIDADRGWSLFKNGLTADLDDVQGGTTAEGIHLGSMAGAVDIVEHRYAGIDLTHDVIHIDPCLPSAIERLRLKQQFRGRWYDFTISATEVEVGLEPDGPGSATVRIAGKDYSIEPSESVTVTL
ncbi:trehalose-phosphatase [Bauldia sp.]|uniref:trehalose-phosphatase n=1 Tax=Bauldia sp. TaxID=2575872 RepID=UPI003BAD71EF